MALEEAAGEERGESEGGGEELNEEVWDVEAARLQPDAQRLSTGEEEGGAGGGKRAPAAEDHRGESEEAAAARHERNELPLLEHQIDATDGGEQPRQQHGIEADHRHRDA